MVNSNHFSSISGPFKSGDSEEFLTREVTDSEMSSEASLITIGSLDTRWYQHAQSWDGRVGVAQNVAPAKSGRAEEGFAGEKSCAVNGRSMLLQLMRAGTWRWTLCPSIGNMSMESVAA